MSGEPCFPNLFVIGAMKAGTTSLHHALSQHPEISMSRVKEPKYFAFQRNQRPRQGPRDPDNNRYWVDEARYSSLFAPSGAHRYRGESSTIYLYSPEAAENLQRQVPEARLIVVLRNPVERAYSHFQYVRQRGLESEASFRRALELEDRRVEQGWGSTWHYRRMGLYGKQLERYLDRFSDRQLFVGLFDDLRSDPEGFHESLLAFLGLSGNLGVEARTVLNRTSSVRSQRVAAMLFLARGLLPPRIRSRVWASAPWKLWLALMRPIHGLNLRTVPPQDPRARELLCDYYASDLSHLESLLQRSVPNWLEPGACP